MFYSHFYGHSIWGCQIIQNKNSLSSSHSCQIWFLHLPLSKAWTMGVLLVQDLSWCISCPSVPSSPVVLSALASRWLTLSPLRLQLELPEAAVTHFSVAWCPVPSTCCWVIGAIEKGTACWLWLTCPPSTLRIEVKVLVIRHKVTHLGGF